MNELIIEDPKWGQHRYLLNNRLAIHVQENIIERLLNDYPLADWHINKLY